MCLLAVNVSYGMIQSCSLVLVVPCSKKRSVFWSLQQNVVLSNSIAAKLDIPHHAHYQEAEYKIP